MDDITQSVLHFGLPQAHFLLHGKVYGIKVTVLEQVLEMRQVVKVLDVRPLVEIRHLHPVGLCLRIVGHVGVGAVLVSVGLDELGVGLLHGGVAVSAFAIGLACHGPVPAQAVALHLGVVVAAVKQGRRHEQGDGQSVELSGPASKVSF